MKKMKHIKLYTEHVASCQNPEMEIDNDDLNHFNGFNDKVLQGPKREFIEISMEDGSSYFGGDFDWRDGHLAKKEFDKYSKVYKYCYNARDGHDSLLLFYTNYKLPRCSEFDSKSEFSNLIVSESYVLPQDIIQDIKDICLELKDMGFAVFTNQLGHNNLAGEDGFYPNLTIFRNENFIFSEIEEVVNRIKDYMDRLGYKVELKKTWADNHGKYKQGKLFQVNIKFI